MESSNITNYERVEKAIKYLIENFRQQPHLEEIARHVGLSNFHFQRLFTEFAGISPKKFLQYITLEALKSEINQTNNLPEAAQQVGLSSPSRVYDLFVSIEAMTPGEYKQKGKGLSIEYGTTTSPFGTCFLVMSEKGICNLQFICKESDKGKLLEEVKQEWLKANLTENNLKAQEYAKAIFYSSDCSSPIPLLLKGTPFQIKVWKALLQIPFGKITSYSELANLTGNKDAVRAVASAVARNPIGYIIPCHRIIRSEGVVGQYHWKPERKATMIGWEKAQLEAEKEKENMIKIK